MFSFAYGRTRPLHNPSCGVTVTSEEDDMHLKIILVVVITCLVVLFIMQNTTAVSIHYLVWTLSMNGALLFFIILMLGIVVGWLMHTFVIFRKKTSRRFNA
jgi:uncharacterized integral membrane protein